MLSMQSNLKRSSSHVPRSVSPPPVKRRMKEAGDASNVTSEPEETCIRVFNWNVNGVNAFLQKRLDFSKQAEFPLRSFLKRHRWPQMLCLQEVKINHRDGVTQRRLQHAANAGSQLTEPTYVVHFSLPRDRFNATGFGGKVHGVATLVREDFVNQISGTRIPDWDLEGRVLIHEIKGVIAIVNGYWVNGTDNPYRDPSTGVVQGTRHDHKLRFHQHMLDESLRLQQSGHQVILIGDMNVARHRIDCHPNLRTSPPQHVKNRLDFNQKFFTAETGLCAVDIFRHMHGIKRKYTYHPRGVGWGQSCDRVDLIVVTKGLLESAAVRSTDICDTAEDRGHSDHVPIWIEFDLAALPFLSSSKSVAVKQKVDSASASPHHP